MTVRLSVHDRRQTDELDRLLEMGFATTALERVLARQFAAGQAATHVVTGSLRGSQDIDSSYAAGVWTGTIAWGGPAPGFENNPVDYAVYEAARGGRHDFREPLQRMSDGYRLAVRAHLKGRG